MSLGRQRCGTVGQESAPAAQVSRLKALSEVDRRRDGRDGDRLRVVAHGLVVLVEYIEFDQEGQ